MINPKLQGWLDSLTVSATPNLDECISYLGDIFPALHSFKDTPQDPIWHAEGDVHIHTEMVLKELYKIFENEEYIPTKSERRILILGAVLHDIGKPFTTVVGEDGRVRAKKHEEVGKNYLALKIPNLQIPTSEIVDILTLVGHHQTPKLLAIKDKPEHDYIAMCHMINYKLIYWLEIADMRGRTAEDLDEQIMYLDEFYRVCYEYSSNGLRTLLMSDLSTACSERELTYKRNVGNHLVRTGQNYCIESAFTRLYEPSKKYSEVIFMCGVSGTGKSTLASDRYGLTHHIICLDKIRSMLGQGPRRPDEGMVIQEAKKMLKMALRFKTNVVLDATNLREELRQQWISIVHDYNGMSVIHVLLRDEKEIFKQNSERYCEVPEDVLKRQIAKFQIPSPIEAHKVIYEILR